jgi:lambda family phage tail tape measure protein
VPDRAKNLERIARELERTLFNITHEGSERIIAEHERRLAEIEALRAKDSSNAQQVDQLIAQSAAVRDAQLSQLRAKEVEAAGKVRAANERVVASLGAEREALAQTERERFVAQALSRPSAEATAQQRREVEQLAGALFDEQQALQARQRLLDEGRSVIDRTRTATEQHAAEVAKLNELLQAGAIDQATYARAVEDANDRALRSSHAWTDGATRFLKDYVAESNDAAAATERAFANAFSGAEDSLIEFIRSGKLEFQGLADSILADLTRMTVRQTLTAPLAGALQSAFAGGSLFGLFHEGGIAGEQPPAVRYADAAVFEHAPRYLGGGFAGSGLALSDAQALRCMVLKLTGTHPGGAYDVHCPTNRKIYVVWNSTAGDATFKTVAGSGIPINAGTVLILYCDGTNVIQLAGLVATIDDIGDVVITAAASGQMLRFNGAS